jgi:hypothetical protein
MLNNLFHLLEQIKNKLILLKFHHENHLNEIIFKFKQNVIDRTMRHRKNVDSRTKFDNNFYLNK